VYEDAMLLTDIINTLTAVNASGTEAILAAFRHKLSQVDLTSDDKDIGSAKQIERLINLCQKYGDG
jgi:hypothetical protein